MSNNKRHDIKIDAMSGAVLISSSNIQFVCPDPKSHGIESAEIAKNIQESFSSSEMSLDSPAKFEDIALIMSYLMHALQRVDWKQEYLNAASEIKSMIDDQKEKDKRSHLKVIK